MANVVMNTEYSELSIIVEDSSAGHVYFRFAQPNGQVSGSLSVAEALHLSRALLDASLSVINSLPTSGENKDA